VPDLWVIAVKFNEFLFLMSYFVLPFYWQSFHVCAGEIFFVQALWRLSKDSFLAARYRFSSHPIFCIYIYNTVMDSVYTHTIESGELVDRKNIGETFSWIMNLTSWELYKKIRFNVPVDDITDKWSVTKWERERERKREWKTEVFVPGVHTYTFALYTVPVCVWVCVVLFFIYLMYANCM